MPLTSVSDIFASVHENGFNKIIRHIMQQRPSLFNYGTAYFSAPERFEKLCCKIDYNPVVRLRNNPLITVEQPLPIFNSDPYVGLNYIFQFCEFVIDFHPGNQFNLPSELNPPLAKQAIAFKIKVCGGIGCPNQKWVKEISDVQDQMEENKKKRSSNDRKNNRDIIPVTI